MLDRIGNLTYYGLVKSYQVSNYFPSFDSYPLQRLQNTLILIFSHLGMQNKHLEIGTHQYYHFISMYKICFTIVTLILLLPCALVHVQATLTYVLAQLQ